MSLLEKEQLVVKLQSTQKLALDLANAVLEYEHCKDGWVQAVRHEKYVELLTLATEIKEGLEL